MIMDETRDESLLSSMSPKIDKDKKKVPKRKAPSKLALKSTLRRSSFYDKLPPTLTNKNIEIVDALTDNSSDTGSSDKPASKERVKQHDVLSESKLTNIINWIDNVQPSTEADNCNISIFSTISSIQGDLHADNNFGAVNSTFAEGALQKRFDDFFLKVGSQSGKVDKKINAEPDSLKKKVTDGSLSGRIDEIPFGNVEKKVVEVLRKKNENIGKINAKPPDSLKKKVINDSLKLSRKIDEIPLLDSKEGKVVEDSFQILRKENEKLARNIGRRDNSSEKKVTDDPFKVLIKYVDYGFEKEAADDSLKVGSQSEHEKSPNGKVNLKEIAMPTGYSKKFFEDFLKLSRKKNANPTINSNQKKNANPTINSNQKKKVLRKENEKLVGKAIAIDDSFDALIDENVIDDSFDALKNDIDDEFDKKVIDDPFDALIKHFDDPFRKKITENPFKASKPVGSIDGPFEKKGLKSCFEEPKKDHREVFKNITHRSKKIVLRRKNEEPFENIHNNFEGKGTDDSFEASKTKNYGEDVLITEDSFEANKENISETDLAIEEDCLEVLDKLYGDQWRKNQNQVLPQSEPRLKKPKAKAKEVPKTEFKPRTLLKYQNPYLDSEKKSSKNVAKILETARRKAALESPWISTLKDLCDSESDEDSEPKTNGLRRVQLDFEDTPPPQSVTKKTKDRGLPHTKLNFDEEDSGAKKVGKCKTNNNMESRNLKTDYRDRKISSSSDDKYDSSSDFEDNGLSLADRLKGKMGVKNVGLPKTPVSVPRGRKLSSSSSSSDNLDYKDRMKDKRMVRIQTKPMKISSGSSSGDSDEKISNTIKRIDINAKDAPKPGTKKIADTKPLSFLASLSKNVPAERCDASARVFKSCYKKCRQELLEKLFKMFNENIFDNAIPADSTIDWSNRMRGTAGYCACRKITRRTGKVERAVRLVLSTKVLDSADRLRDTLVHEMCHAATWVVNEVCDGHGPYWKAWAAKGMKTYPELPAITRCHDYDITTKYTYRCIDCGYSFGRHSKSIDLNTKRCGYCIGTFEVLINKVTKDGDKKSVPATPKKEPTGFALFVKQNYARYKNPKLKHGEVMKILGTKFQEIKVNNN